MARTHGGTSRISPTEGRFGWLLSCGRWLWLNSSYTVGADVFLPPHMLCFAQVDMAMHLLPCRTQSINDGISEQLNGLLMRSVNPSGGRLVHGSLSVPFLAFALFSFASFTACASAICRYSPEIGGVVLSYDKVKPLSDTAQIFFERPLLHFSVSVRLLVFAPEVRAPAAAAVVVLLAPFGLFSAHTALAVSCPHARRACAVRACRLVRTWRAW